MKFEELLKSVMETEAEGESVLVATLKEAGADEDAINVAVANFRLQTGFKDMMSKEEFATVAKAAGFEVAKAKKEDDEDDDEDKFPFKSKKKTKKSHIPEGMPVEMRKAFDDQDAALEVVQKEASDASAQVVVLQKAAERKEYIAKCETQYSYVPGMSIEEMGEMLMKAYGVGEDFGKQLEKSWKETSEAVKKSALLSKAGGNTTNDSSSPMGQIEAFAKELVAKDPSMSEEAAFVKAMEANPEQYEKYLQDNPAQRGR